MTRSIRIGEHDLAVSGGLVKTARVADEEWQETPVEDPEAIVKNLRSSARRTDLWTFMQALTDPKPRFRYHLEWDNFAVVPITTYEEWWVKRLPQETRKNVRRAVKREVVVRAAPFDAAMIAGIKAIYDETPIRQGRRYHHFQKDLKTVGRENSSYLDRSEFIGAYVGEELIGFLKMVRVGTVSRIMQIVSKNAHQDKRPTNALIAKAVEVCVEQHRSHFVYGQYVYGRNTNSPLITFKQRNGFEQLLVPRYYIPLTARGDFALRCNAHRGLREILPERVETFLMDLRSRFYQGQLATT
jgi:hypothetical protein